MLSRIRATIDAFRRPSHAQQASQRPQVHRAIEAHDRAVRRIAIGKKAEDERNPVVVLIEGMLVILFVLYVLDPAIALLRVTEKSHLIMLIIGAVASFKLIESVTATLYPRFSLRFLDPYLGSRLRRTIAAFKKSSA